jgi:hypothetical protein
MPNKIVLSGEYLLEEGIAHEAITPGLLVYIQSDSEVALLTGEKTYHEGAVAIENALAGKTVDDACSSGDRIRYAILQKGAVFYGFLKKGENASVGEGLVATTGGIVRCANSDLVADIRFVAMEALNNTTGASARLKMRVI